MRHIILDKLYDHLQREYSSSPLQEVFAESQLTLRQIDAMCAFKSDPQLDELRSALDRVDDGTFGIYIRCKGEISNEMLDADPVRRVCEACEKALSCIGQEPLGSGRLSEKLR